MEGILLFPEPQDFQDQQLPNITLWQACLSAGQSAVEAAVGRSPEVAMDGIDGWPIAYHWNIYRAGKYEED